MLKHLNMKNPVGWFEIPVNDMERAKTFYENVFQTKLTMEEMGPMQMAQFDWDFEAKGSTGTLIKSEGYEPAALGTIVYFTAPGLEEHLKRVEENGGKTLVPKMQIGEHGYIAHFLDCEGNRVAIHSREG